MKTFILLVLLIAGMSPCYSQSREEMIASLVPDERFQEFAKRFVPNLYHLANYHNTEQVRNNSAQFIEAFRDVEEATPDEHLSDIYTRYSLDYERAIDLTTAIYNDMFGLLKEVPELQSFDSADLDYIIPGAIQAGLNSRDERWINIQLEIEKDLGANELTTNEIWFCAMEAAGIGIISYLSIHAINKAAKEKGVDKVVRDVAKMLIKKAGWIGAAVTLIDFAACIFQEYQD
ncbi:MAG: hypothetical protein K0Q66_885 [Chitinophagaceae bacterium]|jgi:hypothetical protein|nr:hypothetical protein [Chitinophagaceae bacterium]